MSTQDIVAIVAAVAAVVNTVVAVLTWRRLRIRTEVPAPVELKEVEKVRAKTVRRFRISVSLAVTSSLLAVVLVLIEISSVSFPPIVYDFENDAQGWGEHPENELHVEGHAADVNCNKQLPIRYTGDCSLKFTPTDKVDRDAYVTVLENAQGSRIEAYVFIPSGADISTSQGRSAAKIIVWDRNWAFYESDYVELIPGRWQDISWDLRENEWPGPWPEFGLHFWFITDYRGPIYIDNVTLTE